MTDHQIQSLKQIINEAKIESFNYCNPRKFLFWGYNTQHKFSRWIERAAVFNPNSSTAEILLERTCKHCGIPQFTIRRIK